MESSIELSDTNDEINVGDDSDDGERSIQKISDDEDSETVFFSSENKHNLMQIWTEFLHCS